MFPRPIQQSSKSAQFLYKIALPAALILWLLPLIAVALTSIRSSGDIIQGNYWGWPSEFQMFENYRDVFVNTPMLQYIFNSFAVTIPTVLGAVALYV